MALAWDEWDVIVIGGGPAGLTAAVRARWVKGHGAMALKTLVLEPGELGGLAGWKPMLLTGPALRFREAEMPGALLADLRDLHIPVIRAAATAVTLCPGGFRVTTTAGGVHRGRAVVIAAGLRPLANERQFFGKGVQVFFKGQEHFENLIRAAFTHAATHPVLIVGNRLTWSMMPHFEAARAATGTAFRMLVPPGEDWPGESLRGRIAGIEPPGGGPGPPYKVTVEAGGGGHEVLAGAILIDYFSYETQPDAGLALPAGLERLPSGHVRVNHRCETSLPGIFAAGDITGPYYALARALGDGVTAGLGAYKHAYRAIFGRDPILYAYEAGALGETLATAWLPRLDVPGLVAENLVGSPEALAEKLGPVPLPPGLCEAIGGANHGVAVQTLLEKYPAFGSPDVLETLLNTRCIALRTPMPDDPSD